MTKGTKTVLATMLVFYALGVAVCATYSYFVVPSFGHTGFRIEWVFANTASLFLRMLIPIHVSAVLFVYSLFFNPVELRAKGSDLKSSFLGLVKRSLVLFLISAAIYTFLLEGFLPKELAAGEAVVMKASVAEDVRSRARAAMDLQKYDEAKYYLEFYLSIYRDDSEAKRSLEKVLSLKKAVKAAREPSYKGDQVRPVRVENLSISDMISRAWDHYEKEDYISAEYYAGLALQFDDTRPEPKRIISMSREKIARMPLSKEERDKIDFFRMKREGYDMLSRGEFVAAYRHLKRLNEENPSDVDVRSYLAAAYDGLVKESFFLDEISLVSDLPIFDQVMFLNRRTEGGHEFIHFKRMIQTYGVRKSPKPVESARRGDDYDSGLWYKITHLFGSEADDAPTYGMTYYAVDIEGLELGDDGKVRYHFKAPYGKFIDRTLVMRCLHRDGGEEMIPTYFVGRPPEKSPYVVPIGLAPEDLRFLSLGEKDLGRVHVWTLLSMVPLFRSFGLDWLILYRAFFEQIFHPFAFIVLSFFAMGMGWRFRSRYLARPPLACFIFLPVLVFLSILFFQLYHYLWRLISGFSLDMWGFYPALAVFLAVQGVFLALSLIFVAGQVDR